MDIMTQALINIGVESFGMDRKELEECARGIERDDQNRYPRAFKRNGINWEFERTGDGRNSWVGSAGGHSREQYRVTLDPDDENKASFECTRNGRPVASAEVDATQGPELWKIGSDGAKEFYNEMKAEGAAFAAAPAWCSRPPSTAAASSPRTRRRSTRSRPRPPRKTPHCSARPWETPGPPRLSPPVGQTKAAKKIAESKMQPSMPARNEGMHR